ncbi:MAG: hypothetical protein WCG83_06400 [Candidatus Peregrinibacteria bacterium]
MRKPKRPIDTTTIDKKPAMRMLNCAVIFPAWVCAFGVIVCAVIVVLRNPSILTDFGNSSYAHGYYLTLFIFIAQISDILA